MHGTEDVRQKLAVPRALLKFRKAPLHAVQALLAFNQKLACQLVHLTLIGKTQWNLKTACSISGQSEML